MVQMHTFYLFLIFLYYDMKFFCDFFFSCQIKCFFDTRKDEYKQVVLLQLEQCLYKAFTYEIEELFEVYNPQIQFFTCYAKRLKVFYGCLFNVLYFKMRLHFIRCISLYKLFLQEFLIQCQNVPFASRRTHSEIYFRKISCVIVSKKKHKGGHTRNSENVFWSYSFHQQMTRRSSDLR